MPVLHSAVPASLRVVTNFRNLPNWCRNPLCRVAGWYTIMSDGTQRRPKGDKAMATTTATTLRIAGIRSSAQYRITWAGQHQAQPGQIRVVNDSIEVLYDAIYPSYLANPIYPTFNFDSAMLLSEVRAMVRDLAPLLAEYVDAEGEAEWDAELSVRWAIYNAEQNSRMARYR